MNGAIAKPKRLPLGSEVRLLQQFKNPANAAIHETTTGPEIWDDTDGQVDILVSGVGTAERYGGIALFQKSAQQAARVDAVEPTNSR